MSSNIRKRDEKIRKAQRPTLEALNSKEYLTVKEVATLLSCSVRSVYYQIERGKIHAINLGKRMTRIKRTDIDKLFESKNR